MRVTSFGTTVFATILFAMVPFGTVHAMEAREERFELPDHGVLVLAIPLGWKYEIERPSNDLPYTITIRPGDAASFAVMVTPFWSPEGAPDFNSPERVKAIVQASADEALETATETSLTLQPVKGPEAQGFFFFVTDRALVNKIPPPGEYPYAAQGSLAVGDLLLGATILTHEPDSADLRAVMGMLRGARHVPESDTTVPEEVVPWSPDQLQLSGSQLVNAYAGYSLTIPTGWTLGDSSDPGGVHLEGPGDSNISIMIKDEAVDPGTAFKGLALAIAFSGGTYSNLGKSMTRLGKEDAIELLAERNKDGRGRLWERTVGVVHRGRMYILQADAPWAGKKELRAALKALEKSFRFDSR